MIDPLELADDLDALTARVRRLRDSLAPFAGWRAKGVSQEEPDVSEWLAPLEPSLLILERLARELRAGRYSSDPELGPVRVLGDILRHGLDAAEARLAETLAPHGWKLPRPGRPTHLRLVN